MRRPKIRNMGSGSERSAACDADLGTGFDYGRLVRKRSGRRRGTADPHGSVSTTRKQRTFRDAPNDFSEEIASLASHGPPGRFGGFAGSILSGG